MDAKKSSFDIPAEILRRPVGPCMAWAGYQREALGEWDEILTKGPKSTLARISRARSSLRKLLIRAFT
jgi:hypothetical protein